MRILITGSRDWTDGDFIERILSWHMYTPVPIIVHGGCRGADQIAGSIARKWGLQEEVYPAEWNSHGIRAGYIRNRKMVDLGADICLAFILNQSKGATMCANLADKAGIRTMRYYADEPAP